MKVIKGTVFPYGMINSKYLKLVTSKDFYFVTDYWTTTRYPKTTEGLFSAKKHIFESNKISESMKSSSTSLYGAFFGKGTTLYRRKIK